MKQKQKRELERVYAVSDLAAKQHDAKIQKWKDRFAQLRDDVAKEKESWILKYNNLEHLLTLSKDRLYSEKAKCRTLVQRQIDEAKRVEIMLKNYSESLEEENVELRRELGTAIKEKRKAEQASHKSTQLAKEVELTDEKKATWKYLNISKSPYCWECMSDERRQTLLGVAATNDKAESVLGGTTANIQRFGRINLTNASAE